LPLFEYVGFDSGGRKVSGMVEAAGRRAVIQKLQGQGIFPTSLKEESGERALKKRVPGLKLARRVSTVELAGATRQMATLLGAGLPLDEALSTVSSQIDHPVLARSLARVREDVVQGDALHIALSRHGKTFPVLYVNMVHVGENSGTLDQVLEQLADFLEDQARMKNRIRAALAYPTFMAIVGVGVMFFLFAFVVPKVTRMLTDLGQALPLPTLLLIKFSDFLIAYWWLMLLAAVGLAGGLRRYLQTEAGRMNADRKLLKLPLFGRLSLLVATARLCRTLATLLRSGVPLLQALDIVKNLMQNRVLRKALEDTAVSVREGEGLAAPLKRSGAFPPMVSQMAAVGEKSGELEKMLMRVAQAYEHQVDMAITGMLSLLEPMMILFMGGVVGFVVMAILLPIFQASQGLG